MKNVTAAYLSQILAWASEDKKNAITEKLKYKVFSKPRP